MGDIYLLLIATTGSILAALEAGNIPAKIPTTKQMITVLINKGSDTYTGKSNGPERMSVSI